MPKKIIETSDAPKASGCYSQGVLAGNTLYVSGQLPIDPKTGEKLIEKSIEVQAEQVFSNIIEIVKSAGGDIDSIVKVSIYLEDINTWDIINKVYGEIFTKEFPARCVLAIGTLHYGFKIEAEAIAYIEN